MMSQRLKWILRKCKVSGQTLPDILSYLSDKSKAEDTRSFVDHIQFILVHNVMDVGVVDLKRRCECSKMTESPLGYSNGLIASCTGCI